MRHNDRFDERGRLEPAFEPPPRIGRMVERRLAGRAAALWQECRGDAAMPSALRYDADRGATPLDDFTGNSIMLAIDREGAVVSAVSPQVAAVFGLAAGRLDAAAGDSLAARLQAAAKTLGDRPAAIPFEGMFAADGAGAATLLTRGVVLPLAGPAGDVVAAHVVVTWKEMLSSDASARLHRELGLALRGVAGSGRTGDVFATPEPHLRH